MIQINNRLDSRIASNFPNDPDGHLCITTATKKLNLQLAFLSIDSDYFAEVDPDTRHIELNHLPE